MNALQVRLVMLNRHLDKENLGKVERCRIRREVERLRLRIEGRDPGWFAGIGVKGGKPEPEKRNAYAQKKSVIELIDLLNNNN